MQLDRIGDLVARKRQIFDWYTERLECVPVTLNVERPGDRNTFWMVTAVLDPTLGIGSEYLAQQLKAVNVPTRPFFWPLSSLTAYHDSPDVSRARDCNGVSYDLAPRGINLPSALTLTEAQVDRVCRALTQTISAAPSGASIRMENS